MTRKKLKLRDFIEQCFKEGTTKPADILAAYNALLEKNKKKPVTLQAVSNACRRLGANRDKRESIAVEVQRQEAGKDILEYQQVKNYLTNSEMAGITQNQIDRQLKAIRRLWLLMGSTDPTTWKYEDIIAKIKEHFPMKTDERKRVQFVKMGAVKLLLTALNTFFPSILPKGWSAGLTREKGELKDFFTFEEFNEFLSFTEGTADMSATGWRSMFAAQVNLGCREGRDGLTGITSLAWEDINFETKRAKLREKGGRGKAKRQWVGLPLDLFPWLKGWGLLEAWHYERFGYVPTNDKHGTGKVFLVDYGRYLEHFHKTRKLCNGRIAGGQETLTPHILRKTHAQWLVKLWYPIEQIAGQFPNGRLGVGWDNLQILLGYYVTIESEQFEKADKIAAERMSKLGLQ